MEALSFLKKNYLSDPLQQSLNNKKVQLPPNQIITKQYAPDIKPLVKLMTKQQLQKSQKNITYIPPKIKNQQFEKYGQKFHPMDFLGYKYSQQFDQMVYFRYNNEQFNQYRQNGSQKGTKYFAGLFIPLQALKSRQFKTQDNIYNALNLSVPQIKDSITQSFSKNCKGCSFDPLFSSNYASGNMMAAIRKKPFQYDIILQNDTNSKAVQWFNFAVKFIQQGTYTFNIVNLSNQNPLYQMGMKIPCFSFLQQSLKIDNFQSIKSGNGWVFGGKNISISKTDIRKENQLLDQTYFSLSFQFKCKNRQQIVVFASSIPYTSLDYERFLNRVLYNKIGQHMKMQKVDICQSLGGSLLSGYVFYHRKSKSNTLLLKNSSQQKLLDNFRSNDRQKTLNLSSSSSSTSLLSPNSILESLSINPTKSIVFLARQHSGESCSSFILEGIIQFLMDNTQFDVFKKSFQFVIIPFINPDGVKYGNQKTNLSGSDLDKCWKNPNQIFEPQVYHIKKFLKKVNQIHPIALMINLSSNSHTLSSYFTSSSCKKSNDEAPQLFPYICSKRIPQISYQKSQFNQINKPSFVKNLSDTFPKSLIYDLNTSNYGWKNQNVGFRRYTETNCVSEQQYEFFQFTPEIYRNMGRQLITTYLEYVRLCEKNIGIKDRWLKQIQEYTSLYGNKKQPNTFQIKYQQTWNRQLIRFDFSIYVPTDDLKNQKSEGRKHKTSIQYRYSGSNVNELRSRSKKLTMQGKNGIYSKQVRVDSQKSPKKQGQQKSIQNESMNGLLNEIKKSPLTSSIFTPKKRSQLLKQISSQTIKQSSLEKQNSFIIQNKNHLNKLPNHNKLNNHLNINTNSIPLLNNINNQNNTINQSSNLQKIIQRKQKRLSKLIFQQKNQSLVPKTLVLKQQKQQDSKNKIKDAIVKFQNMKKFISAMGIKAQTRGT